MDNETIESIALFQFRDLHPDLFIGTASDRYAGWMGQIYAQERFGRNITRRSKKIGDKTYADEVLPVLGRSSKRLYLPGFGSSILAECDRPHSVLPTAIDYRNSREARAFRSWIGEMSNALADGDIHTIAMGLRDVRDVARSVRKASVHTPGRSDGAG